MGRAYRAAGDGAAYEDVNDDHQADREAEDCAADPHGGGDGKDHRHQNEGERSLHSDRAQSSDAGMWTPWPGPNSRVARLAAKLASACSHLSQAAST